MPVYGVGTVQEEVGLRGAKTSAEVVKPDVCLVIESGVATDVPCVTAEDNQVKLGGGPILYACDGGMVGHRRLRDFIMKIADKKKIPYQLAVLMGGATDGAPIHVYATGVPAILIGVPARYIHCQTGVIHADDFDHTVSLVVETVKQLNTPVLASIVGARS